LSVVVKSWLVFLLSAEEFWVNHFAPAVNVR
jgi:hypothetical protein